MKTFGPFLIKSLDYLDKFRFTKKGTTYTYLGEGEYQKNPSTQKLVCADSQTKIYLIVAP